MIQIRVMPMATAAWLMLATAASAQQAPAQPFEPVVGQPGKDVVWVPTPPETVEKMLDIARVTPADFVIDLGSGDGRNVIAAARRGARALGVEFNPEMVELSKRLAAEAGVGDTAQFVQGDMFQADISKANVMALFLLPSNMFQLRSKFFNLAPGSRIVSNTFGMEGWEPDYTETRPDCQAWCSILLWIVPAKVAGTWTTPQGELVLTQDFQNVAGTLGSAAITEGKLRGEEITFVADGRTYTGRVRGDVMDGTVSGGGTWSARR
ncbi:MAG: class I SAM-dependent methyltransferase [Vicinamibacterales bacterium]